MTLFVLLNGEKVGVVEQAKAGKLVFTYDDRWREQRDAFQLSLSMPLAVSEHPDPVTRPFLEGLLPDNAGVLDRWAREFQVSPRNPFALLTHMGEDCAGAVQLVRPDRIAQARASGDEAIDWLDDAGVSARLRDAKYAGGTGRISGDRGRFSLAGAQPKTALFFDGKRWGVPSGAVPTTHILKPPTQSDLEGFAVNEHFCLTLARQLGMRAAKSFVLEFEGESAIVVERYDRAIANTGAVKRLHQEDACQALAVPPSRKYENEGGPGAPEIVGLLNKESSDPAADVASFVDALALNWAVAGTDAHAKNYSILLSPLEVRLAPLYDVISALPYPDQISPRQQKLAMRVDSEYAIRKIARRHWEGLAARCDLDAEPLIQRVEEVLQALPGAASAAVAEVSADGLEHNVLDRLEVAIRAHSMECLSRLGQSR
jgi:serine/threonine-protein kinase HipA